MVKILWSEPFSGRSLAVNCHRGAMIAADKALEHLVELRVPIFG
jgi:hypothetical protein